MDPARLFDPANEDQAAFVRAVEVRMDEVTPDGETPRVQREKIYAFACEACDAALAAAPSGALGVLSDSLPAPGAVESYGRTRGVRFEMGPDVVRLVSVLLPGWFAPVYAAAEAGPGYELERNPHHVRPAARPVVYRVPSETGEALECFPAASATGDYVALVVRRQRPEALLADLPQLAAAVAWDAAARTLAAERYYDPAKAASEMAAATLTP